MSEALKAKCTLSITKNKKTKPAETKSEATITWNMRWKCLDLKIFALCPQKKRKGPRSKGRAYFGFRKDASLITSKTVSDFSSLTSNLWKPKETITTGGDHCSSYPKLGGSRKSTTHSRLASGRFSNSESGIHPPISPAQSAEQTE